MKNNKPVLLILAAGMGSRYGGLKQLDRLGPNGETIMDYSVRDAIAAGFDKVVFVIRQSMEAAFCETIVPKYKDRIRVDWVFQELDGLPAGFMPNPDREKPYGTAHAILVAKTVVNEPFTVINADDFYGVDAFRTMADFLQKEHQSCMPQYAMVGYQLGKTLSENGTVSRGVCQTDSDGNLTDIQEVYRLRKYGNLIKSVDDAGQERVWLADTPVSMNFWGFHPSVFAILETMFVNFLTENVQNPMPEFQIPAVVNRIIRDHTADIKVLHSKAEWFGVTYKEDRDFVVEKLKNMEIEKCGN